MKLFFKYEKPVIKNLQVWVKLEGKPEQHVLDKVPGFAIRRRSKYSFFYKDKLYDIKNNLIIPKISKAYGKYLNDSN